MNGDSHLDLLAAIDNSPMVCLLLGTGSFGTATTYSAGPNSYPHGLTTADVNGDGQFDMLIASTGNNTAGVLLRTTPVLTTLAALPGARATRHPNPTRGAATLTATGLTAATHTVELTLFSLWARLCAVCSCPPRGEQQRATCPRLAWRPDCICCSYAPSRGKERPSERYRRNG